MLDQLHADLNFNLDQIGKTKLEVNSHFRNSEVLFLFTHKLAPFVIVKVLINLTYTIILSLLNKSITNINFFAHIFHFLLISLIL